MDRTPIKLMDRVRHKIRMKHYSIRTEEAYTSWIKRYIYFFHKRHPRELGKDEIEKLGDSRKLGDRQII